MTRNGRLAAALLSLAGLAHAAMPDGAQFARDVVSGQVDPEKFDFAAAGYWDLAEPARRTWFSDYVVALGVMDPKSSQGCSPEALRREAAMIWNGPLQSAPDAASWSAAMAPLRAQLAAFDAFIASTSTPPAPPGSKPDPRVDELRARVAREQAMRGALTDPSWTRDLPPLAASWWMGAYSLRYGVMDCPNTEWLRRQLAQIGWFDIPTYGEEADGTAWLIVQHADRSPEFQREVLALLQGLPKEKTSQRHVAYLWDRVARAQGKPQRYGTQGSCEPDGSWKPFEVEDPAHLDERRVALGMTPIDEHIREFTACPKPVSKPAT